MMNQIHAEENTEVYNLGISLNRSITLSSLKSKHCILNSSLVRTDVTDQG